VAAELVGVSERPALVAIALALGRVLDNRGRRLPMLG
jgi:hypothetical protein